MCHRTKPEDLKHTHRLPTELKLWMPFSDVHLLSYILMRLIQTALACALMVSCPFSPSHAALAPAVDAVYVLWSFEPPAPTVLQKEVQLELQPAADTVSPTMVPVPITSCRTAAVTAPLLNYRRSTLITHSRYFEICKTTLWNIMFKAYIMTLILQPPKYNTN